MRRWRCCSPCCAARPSRSPSDACRPSSSCARPPGPADGAPRGQTATARVPGRRSTGTVAPVTTVCWFRRDLRVRDHPALLTAREAAGDGAVVALYVLDPALWRTAGAPRLAYLVASLRALDEQLGGRLVVRTGEPATVVPAVAREVGATGVHVSAATEPFGRRRDSMVERALHDAARPVPLVATGSPTPSPPAGSSTAPAHRSRCSRPTGPPGSRTGGTPRHLGPTDDLGAAALGGATRARGHPGRHPGRRTGRHGALADLPRRGPARVCHAP
ncbi:deoxyribodipyrimidine photo-lyase [Cellulomonas soli]